MFSCEIRNTVVGIRNPSSTGKGLESSDWNPESTAWDPETKTVLDPFIHGANGFTQE